MVEQQIHDFLIAEGYTKIPSNLPEFTIYFRMENSYVNVFHVIDCQRNLYLTADVYAHVKEKIKVLFAQKGIFEIHILSLVISKNTEKARKLGEGDAFCWLVDAEERRLLIYENQVNDFYGMREKLESALAQDRENDITDRAVTQKKRGGGRRMKIPYVTAGIVLINTILFLICAWSGDLLYNIGAFSASYFMEDKEYYRVVTAIFLHWDINHLISNMVVLYYLGGVVEKNLGRVGYGCLYLASGICGNLISLLYESYEGTVVRSVGASGAVFGVIGALLVLVLIHKGHLQQITIGRLLFMIVYSLYSGFVSSGINNAAHIGGFLCGMAAAALICFVNRMIRKVKVSYEN